jgi:hypothetical protein
MEFKVNRRLLDLATLYATMSHSVTWDITNDIRSAKDDLECAREELTNGSLFDGHYKRELGLIDEQLKYININLKTLEEALMCHETKIFEKRIALKDLQLFGLN